MGYRLPKVGLNANVPVITDEQKAAAVRCIHRNIPNPDERAQVLDALDLKEAA